MSKLNFPQSNFIPPPVSFPWSPEGGDQRSVHPAAARTPRRVLGAGPTRWHKDRRNGPRSRICTLRDGRRRCGTAAMSGAEVSPDKWEGASEPPGGAATAHLTRHGQKRGGLGLHPPNPRGASTATAGKSGCKAVAHQTIPTLGFHPRPHHSRSLSSRPKSSAGMEAACSPGAVGKWVSRALSWHRADEFGWRRGWEVSK